MAHGTTKESQLMRWFIVSSIVLGIIVLFLSCITHYEHAQINDLTKVQQELHTRIAASEDAIKKQQTRIAQRQQYLHLLDKFNSYTAADNQHFIDTLLTDIATLMPYDSYLSSLERAHKNQLMIKGYASSAQSVLLLLQKMRDLAYICAGKIIHLKAKDENSMVEFLIRLEVKPYKEGGNDAHNKKTILA